MHFSLIGFGLSNKSVMNFILDHKMGDVFVSEKGQFDQESLEILSKNEVEYEENGHTSKASDADIVVYSPSVRPDSKILEMARSHGAKTMGELEFAYRYALSDATIVAITGSNGKTTTTSIVDHILTIAKMKHFTGGNIGVPSIERKDEPIVVLEVSSFQLMGCDSFHPHIGSVLNISANHLNWHKDMEEYISAKMKLSNADIFLYNADDQFIPESDGIKISKDFGDVCVEEREFWIDGQHFSLEGSKLLGLHNTYNAAFAAMICELIGVQPEAVEEGLKTFSPLPHRQERVAEIDGVVYINDSKSTTSESSLIALQNFDNAIVIIGGRPKEKEYAKLANGIREKAKFAIVMGDMIPMMADLLKDFPHDTADSVEEAVKIAQRVANKGDVVLFSPAATSFDMFKNYKERGEAFKRIVLNGKIDS